MNRFFPFLMFVLFIPATMAQWQKQLSGTSEDLNDVAVLNQTSAVAVGNNGIILKTSNAGLNWVQVNSGTINELNAVSFRDEQNGIAVGDGIICSTTDGGESWSVSDFNKNAITISFRNLFGNSIVIIGCDDGVLYYSSSGGSIWNDSLYFPEGPIIAVGFNSNTYNFLKAYAATTYHTAANFTYPSNNWKFFDNPVNPVWDELTGGYFSESNQYLVGWYANPGPVPALLRRIDSDTTWECIYWFVPSPFIPEDIIGINETSYVCGSNGKIFKSTDFADNWTEQLTKVTEDFNALDFISEAIGYCVGNNGIILYTSNGGVSSVEETNQPVDYQLFQNYPNPFNPSTKIRFTIPITSFVTLKVYNILAKELFTLLNEERPAGDYEINFNAEYLSSGIYFFELTAGYYKQTRKMILNK